MLTKIEKSQAEKSYLSFCIKELKLENQKLYREMQDKERLIELNKQEIKDLSLQLKLKSEKGFEFPKEVPPMKKTTGRIPSILRK